MSNADSCATSRLPPTRMTSQMKPKTTSDRIRMSIRAASRW